MRCYIVNSLYNRHEITLQDLERTRGRNFLVSVDVLSDIRTTRRKLFCRPVSSLLGFSI